MSKSTKTCPGSLSDKGSCSRQEAGGLCVCICVPATGELLQGQRESCVRGGVYGRAGGLTVVGQLWVGVEVGGAAVRCVCSPCDCQKLCSLLSTFRVASLGRGNLANLSAGSSPGAPAVLAVWGAPCPLGAVCLESQALLPAKAFVSFEPSSDIPSDSERERA